MKYFDQLKKYSDSIVISIKHDIRQILQNYLFLAAKSEHDSAAFSSSFSSLFSCFASILRSFSFKKIKIMLKSKRISLTVTTIQNDELSCYAIVLRHEVCRRIIDNRLKEKRTMKDFSKNRQLFTDQEEAIILEFVNDFIDLRFSFRLYMIEEKIIFLLQKRKISNSQLKRQ